MPFKKGRTAILEEDVQRRGGELPATAEQAERAEPQAPLVMAPQRTVLGAAAQVKGDIASEEPIVIEGRVQGNIVCSKQVSVTGVVVGNITCQSFSLNSGKVKGDLVCSGSARVAESGEIEGAVTAQELARWAEEARYFVDAEFMVDDLEALRRGGRIPSSVAYAGSKLDVKPLLTITVDGKLSLAGVARGRKKGIKQLAEYYNKRKADSRPGRCVVIGNADCPKDAARLQEALGKGDDSILFLESSIGPVIGSHVGPDMIAVVFWGNDKREELSVADRIAKKVKGGE